MKRIRIALLAGLLLLGCGTAQEAHSYRQIDAETAIEWMERETNYVLLDVRTQQEYDDGHIPGAICIPNETIKDEKPDALPDKEQMIFVYCRSGNRSKQAAGKLAALGYTNVVEFGGIIDWPGEVTR